MHVMITTTCGTVLPVMPYLNNTLGFLPTTISPSLYSSLSKNKTYGSMPYPNHFQAYIPSFFIKTFLDFLVLHQVTI